MRAEEEERPRFVAGGYRRHRYQWVKGEGNFLSASAVFKELKFKSLVCPKNELAEQRFLTSTLQFIFSLVL